MYILLILLSERTPARLTGAVLINEFINERKTLFERQKGLSSKKNNNNNWGGGTIYTLAYIVAT